MMNSLIPHSRTTLTTCPRAGALLTGALLMRARRQLRPSRLTALLARPHTRQYSGHPIREQKPRVRPQSLLTLAIETSCDDTCVAIVEKKGGAAKILFNKTITSDSSQYRGIHPVLAVQSHEQNIKTLIEEAKDTLPFVKIAPGSPRRGEKRKPNFITVTRGPGMNQSLGIGIDTAKELAFSWGIPILGVHHMQAHALTPRLVDALAREWPAPGEEKLNTTPMPPYPFLTLLVSGGHTQLVLSTSLTSHSVVVDTADVSIGDLLDKCAREILPKKVLSTLNTGSYGAALEKFAWPDAATDPMYDYDCYKVPPKREDEVKPWVSQERGWIVPAPLAGSRELKYNFTGLGGVIRQYAQTLSQYDFSGRQTLARVVMKLAFEHVVGRIIMVLQQYKLTPDGQPKNAAEAPWTAAYAQKQLDMKNKVPKPPKPSDSSSSSSDKASPFFTSDSFADAFSNNNNNNNTTTTTTKPPPSSSSSINVLDPYSDNRIKLILSGGVASNKYLRFILRQWLNARKFPHIRAVAPPLEYCTDNAAMIAWTGFEMFEAGWRTPLESISPTRRWSLDPAIKPTKIGTLKRDEYGVGLMEEGYFVKEERRNKDEVVKKRGFDDFDDFARKHGFN
ncbi:glycoprotease family-domain-containing protein [Rhypophila decipiens]|uniref:N(6)-L-threonylcarbamoyladenine synthase n=1 Tax=Rhypophila decipiens TaxID=261697 RepID=A0AAN6Y5X7_9PEZI|nr:glycoprotease family-domain-containing protein [Rhypophila decipiens]